MSNHVITAFYDQEATWKQPKGQTEVNEVNKFIYDRLFLAFNVNFNFRSKDIILILKTAS